ncbi:uncharacterized protein LOC134474300 isoform X1 [Cavia porcellus]|uniref:uncharacterized protein LOC134474300 isoform X1 n=1 Tax=Cavia porcellus TaxID=10141 RepID=UPI002FE0C1B2
MFLDFSPGSLQVLTSSWTILLNEAGSRLKLPIFWGPSIVNTACQEKGKQDAEFQQKPAGYWGRSATLTGEGNPRERAQPTDQRPNRQLRIPPAFHQRGPTTGFLAAVRSAPRSPSHPSSGLAPRRGSRPPISAHCASSPRLNRPPACPSPSPGSTPCPGPRGRALPTRMPQSGPGLRLAAPSRTLHLRPSPVREPQMGRPLPQSAALCRPRGALFRDLALRARPGQPCPEERLFWAGPRSSCDPRTSRQGACPG